MNVYPTEAAWLVWFLSNSTIRQQRVVASSPIGQGVLLDPWRRSAQLLEWSEGRLTNVVCEAKYLQSALGHLSVLVAVAVAASARV